MRFPTIDLKFSINLKQDVKSLHLETNINTFTGSDTFYFKLIG